MPSHERAEILPPFERSIVLAEGVMGEPAHIGRGELRGAVMAERAETGHQDARVRFLGDGERSGMGAHDQGRRGANRIVGPSALPRATRLAEVLECSVGGAGGRPHRTAGRDGRHCDDLIPGAEPGDVRLEAVGCRQRSELRLAHLQLLQLRPHALRQRRSVRCLPRGTTRGCDLWFLGRSLLVLPGGAAGAFAASLSTTPPGSAVTTIVTLCPHCRFRCG